MSEWINTVKKILGERDESGFYSEIHFRESIGSTNAWVGELADEGAPGGTIAAADEQTAGRGRRGRTWVSPAGENIYFSLLLRPKFPAGKASALTLVMGLSAAKAVREVTGLPAGIKWPNDLVLDNRKICGILTEMKVNPDGSYFVVIGTGINVNQTAFDETIRHMAVSLRLENGNAEIDRGLLLSSVLLHFRENYMRYSQTEDLTLLLADYNSLLVSRGKQIRVEDPKGPYTAVSLGASETGALEVRLPDGEVREITGGEVSVRGMYGYV